MSVGKGGDTEEGKSPMSAGGKGNQIWGTL